MNSVAAVDASPARRARPAALACIFIALVGVMLALADPDCYRLGGQCFASMDRYYGSTIARGLLEHGALVSIDVPDRPLTDHPPVFAFAMAALFKVFGTATVLPVMILNAVLILLAALMIRRFAEHYAPGSGDVAMALVLFNPNVLGQGLLAQTEAMHMAAVTAGLVLTSWAAARPDVVRGFCAGAMLGFSALVRPASLTLGLILPFVLPALSLTGVGRRVLGPALAAGLAGAVACVVVVSPWAVHQHRAGEGWRISSNAIEDLLFVMGVMYLDPAQPGTPNGALSEALTVERAEAMRAAHPDWDGWSPAEQGAALRAYVISHYRTVALAQPLVVGIALAKSWARFLFAGGEGALHDLFGIAGTAEQRPGPFYGVKAAAIGFALVARLLALAGVWWLVGKRKWDALILCTGIILWFMATTVLIGQPRYRMAAEPALMFLAAVGLAALSRWPRRPAHQGS